MAAKGEKKTKNPKGKEKKKVATSPSRSPITHAPSFYSLPYDVRLVYPNVF
jgi:hypothetical protein